jgi:hypothetical protein
MVWKKSKSVDQQKDHELEELYQSKKLINKIRMGWGKSRNKIGPSKAIQAIMNPKN